MSSQKYQISKIWRVGIDGRFYGPRGKGLGRYVQKLVDSAQNSQFLSLQEIPRRGRIPNIQFVIFLRRENWNEFNPINPNFKKVLADYKWYGFLEQMLFPIKIWRHKIDLMHFPHFNAPIFCPFRFVVTIHDLILRKFPTKRGGLHSAVYPFKKLLYNFVIRRAIKNAEKIITVSNFTKKDILENFNVPEEKIAVIYEGAQLEELGIRNQESGIREPYILYVGNAYPHKNLERLVGAFVKLNQESRLRQYYDGQVGIRNYDYRLVLVGEIDYFYDKLRKFVRNSKFIIPDSIIFTDFVSDSELNNLYKNASLYIFPSLYEGFGLPPLEAMARGVPVVSSNQTALPEILGDAALYFDPYSVEDIVEKIKMALENAPLREEFIKKGFERIKKYNWEKMAKETLEIYWEALKIKNKI